MSSMKWYSVLGCRSSSILRTSVFGRPDSAWEKILSAWKGTFAMSLIKVSVKRACMEGMISRWALGLGDVFCSPKSLEHDCQDLCEAISCDSCCQMQKTGGSSLEFCLLCGDDVDFILAQEPLQYLWRPLIYAIAVQPSLQVLSHPFIPCGAKSLYKLKISSIYLTQPPVLIRKHNQVHLFCIAP